VNAARKRKPGWFWVCNNRQIIAGAGKGHGKGGKKKKATAAGWKKEQKPTYTGAVR